MLKLMWTQPNCPVEDTSVGSNRQVCASAKIASSEVDRISELHIGSGMDELLVQVDLLAGCGDLVSVAGCGGAVGGND